MTTLVTGARGRVGRAVLDALLAVGVDDLRASGRDAGLLDVSPRVATVSADLADPSSLGTALDGVDQVFLYAEPQGAAGVAAAARDAGVKHVVVLSSMSVHDDPDGIGGMHRAVEDAVTASGLVTTLLRPGAFAANALDWAGDVRERGVVETVLSGAHTTPIHERDIADVAVDALTGGRTRGAAVTLSGPESLTFRDQAAILGAEIGREIDVVELDADGFRAKLSGAPAFVADALLALWRAADGVPQPVSDTAPVLGRPGRSFAQWAHDHRDAFV